MHVTVLDHLVVAAATLDDGLRWGREQLGVDIPLGGRHERFATHNRVLRLGDASYLEIIAIDPAAPSPDRPRWMGLDDPALRESLASGPKLIAWVAASDDIRRAATALPLASGPVEPVRRGTLEWLMTVPPDGSLAEGGTLPPLIQWSGPRPASAMPDHGFRLAGLDLGHPEPERLLATLAAIGLADDTVRVHHADAPTLSARIVTPSRRTVGIT